MTKNNSKNISLKTKLLLAFIILIALYNRFGFYTKNIKSNSAYDGYFKVIGVSDGDTIKILKDNEPITVRLHGIDCPERKQPFHKKAKQFTSKHTLGKTVFVNKHSQDKYKRWVADVILPDGNNLNHLIVENGLGWWFFKYAPNDTTLKNLEAKARKAKLNIWSDPNPIPPWEFRKK